MRFSILIIVFFISSKFSFAQFPKDSIALKYSQTILATDLSEYLHILASDSMEGRATGEPGQKMAARYLAGKFKEFGLEPGVKKNGGEYFQKFELVKKEWQDVYLTVKGNKKVFLKDFYVYGDLNYPEETKAEVVFAGYGIETEKYSDYYTFNKKRKALDVKNKVVILLPGDPVIDGKSLVTGSKDLSSWANDWRRKVTLAKAKGAKAVCMVVGKNQSDFELRLAQLKDHLGKPTLGFNYKERPSAFFIPMALAADMLGTSSENLIKYNERRSMFIPELASETKQTEKSNPFKIKPVKISLKCSVKETKISTENILGYIEGTDKKDELVVLTAHYDHLGKEGNHIYYGADDDGTGTVALLELAQAFAKAKKEGHGPRRSILIMPVTGEEKGLMGSEYYTDHPEYPLKNTIVDLNIDMIGRLDSAHANNPDYVYLIGTNRLSPELHEISEAANKTYTNIQMDYTFNSFNDPNRFYFRSDHYNFAKNNIPVIFYFNGVHEDYHRPTDTADKILFNKTEKITRLVFFTAWELANREKRIEVNVKTE